MLRFDSVDDGVWVADGSRILPAPNWPAALERVRERTDEDGDNQRQVEKHTAPGVRKDTPPRHADGSAAGGGKGGVRRVSMTLRGGAFVGDAPTGKSNGGADACPFPAPC